MQRRKEVHAKAQLYYFFIQKRFYRNRHNVKAIRNFSDHI